MWRQGRAKCSLTLSRRAEPLYAKAREAFIASGDERNALYAEVSRLRGQLLTLLLPEVSERLSDYLDNPLVQNDEESESEYRVCRSEGRRRPG